MNHRFTTETARDAGVRGGKVMQARYRARMTVKCTCGHARAEHGSEGLCYHNHTDPERECECVRFSDARAAATKGSA